MAGTSLNLFRDRGNGYPVLLMLRRNARLAQQPGFPNIGFRLVVTTVGGTVAAVNTLVSFCRRCAGARLNPAAESRRGLLDDQAEIAQG
jgi:hypothetical protein